MKRPVAFLFVVSLTLNCAEQPNAPRPDVPVPAFAISDGAHGGNSHFYFHPPLVPSPTFSGEFTPTAAPTVRICQLAESDPTLLTAETACAPVVTEFGPTQIAVSLENELYQVNWKTGEANGIGFPNLYRIQVFSAAQLLGFRDVAPKDSPTEVPKNPETDAVYAFLNGSTNPIKFRIEKGFFCATLTFDEVNGQCNEGSLADGVTVQNAQGGIGIPPQQTLSGFVGLIVEPCMDANGAPAHLPIDLPLYGPGCIELRMEPPLPEGQSFDAAATVFFCQVSDLDFPSQRVRDLVTVHKSEALSGEPEPVFALPHAPDLCPPAATASRGTGGNWLARLAHDVGAGLAAVFQPRPLHASLLHRGLGGHTEICCSFFELALPAKGDILEGNQQVAPAGTAVAVDPAVLVTDLDDEPVLGATVHFEVVTGNGIVEPMSVVTGPDGVARVTKWVLGDLGLNQLRAFARGMADPVTNGPRAGFDPFQPLDQPDPADEEPVQLHTGQVTFDATACGDGFGTIVVDGVLDEAWACAQVDVTFSANLSGGSGTPARLLIMNDATNLYVAVAVRRSAADKVNVLTLEFDHNGNGARNLGEDVLEVESNGVTTVFLDKYITSKCVTSSQAACGDPDIGDGGTTDGLGAFQNDGTFSVYELSHPLASGDAAHDFARTVSQQLGVLVYLRHGSGAQGKTEFPANRQPLVFTIK